MKRIPFLLLIVLALSFALAADVGVSVETRLAIVEDRLERLASDVDLLKSVPSQLARIEEQIKQLAEQSGNNSNIIWQIVMVVVTSAITGTMAFVMGKRTGH